MALCRMDIFQGNYGYQGWNSDPTMEERMARLPGSGSFYWPSARDCYRAAGRFIRSNKEIHQIKIETISGQEVGRLFRPARTNQIIKPHWRRVGPYSFIDLLAGGLGSGRLTKKEETSLLENEETPEEENGPAFRMAAPY